MNKKMRALLAQKAQHVTAMRAINDAASAAERDLTEAEATQFAGLKAQLEATNAAIDREQLLIEAEKSAGIVIPDNAHITATDNRADDPTRGFRSVGDFYRAVAHAGMGKAFDERLSINAAAPTTFSNESGGADGGFSIPPQFSQELWRLSLGEDSYLPMTANTEISGNSMISPKDESTPWGGSGANVD